jgi:hypothetical protein
VLTHPILHSTQIRDHSLNGLFDLGYEEYLQEADLRRTSF